MIIDISNPMISYSIIIIVNINILWYHCCHIWYHIAFKMVKTEGCARGRCSRNCSLSHSEVSVFFRSFQGLKRLGSIHTISRGIHSVSIYFTEALRYKSLRCISLTEWFRRPAPHKRSTVLNLRVNLNSSRQIKLSKMTVAWWKSKIQKLRRCNWSYIFLYISNKYLPNRKICQEMCSAISFGK